MQHYNQDEYDNLPSQYHNKAKSPAHGQQRLLDQARENVHARV